MQIIKWSPWDDMERFFEDFSGHLPVQRNTGAFVPAMNVYQEQDQIVVETSLAGVDPKNVEISIENDILTVKGKSQKQTEVDEKNYYHKEVSFGSFYRSLPLPAQVVGEKAKATFENGVLKIEIPKMEVKKIVKPITIEIKNNLIFESLKL